MFGWIGEVSLGLLLVTAFLPSRAVADDTEFWLRNQIEDHGYTVDEAAAGLGMAKEDAQRRIKELGLSSKPKPPREPDGTIRVRPWAPGRHPRIGFLDGAVNPQRDTKLSIFLPWEDSGFIVFDLPEAVFSNLGLLYLAHTHVPTIWEKEKVALERLDWKRGADGTLSSERTLPNKVKFGARVTPKKESVDYEYWLENGTAETLTGLRNQICLLLKNAPAFNGQTKDNKVLMENAAAARSKDGLRWIVTACEKSKPWQNPDCPCMHADPTFPDCPPGGRVRVRGRIFFYEGADVKGEIERRQREGRLFMDSPAEAELRRLEERGVRANPYRPGRPMTMSRNGIVATSQALASQAGLDMLRSGGKAMDAAVAAAATLAVVEPMMTGMGGDVFMLYYEAKTGKVHALNGSGHSPMKLTREYFKSKPKEEIDGNSWEAVTVPGAVDAWCAALARFGSKPISEVLAPAIRYAEEGFPVTETIAGDWADGAQNLTKDPWTSKTYLVEGRIPKRGEVFKNPNLAKSLRTVAEQGRDGYYKGPIAAEIVRYAAEGGGFLTMEDFAAHASTWVEPVTVNYRGYDVYQCPPNGQGLGVLLMLNLLEGYDLRKMKHNSPEYLHLLIEAKKLAYADLYRYVADPEKSKVPIPGLLSKTYAVERRKLIDPARAAPSAPFGMPEGSDTIYLTAIDKEGNAVSFINSIYSAFGSKITGGETGILLQNRGDGFTLEPGHPNEYAPGKRPYHTIIPGMVLKNGTLYMSYGLMGGAMQPQGHVQFLLSHLDFGLSPQEANDVPRWRHLAGLKILLEHGTPRATMEALRRMGHEVDPASGGEFGGCQAILVDPATGTYFGASDSRKDGAALGY